VALRDEARAKTNKSVALTDWLNGRKNKKEWWDVVLDMKSFSAQAIVELCAKHGFTTDANCVHRVRKQNEPTI